MQVSYDVRFQGQAPDGLKVGDLVHVSLMATVHQITGDLVDITRLGSHPEFILGEVGVSLIANTSEVKPA